MQKEYIEREPILKDIEEMLNAVRQHINITGRGSGKTLWEGIGRGIIYCSKKLLAAHAADVIEADRLGRVGRLMLPYKGCPRGPIGRLGMAGGKTQDKKAILVEELCCMDTFEDVDGNVWRPVQEEVLQEVIEILRKVVEVVRCKDCKYCIPAIADDAEYELCIVDNDVFPVSVQKQHFCGRGKRKEK